MATRHDGGGVLCKRPDAVVVELRIERDEDVLEDGIAFAGVALLSIACVTLTVSVAGHPLGSV